MVEQSTTPYKTDKACTRWSWWWTGRWIWEVKFQIQTWCVKTGGEELNFHIDPTANVIAVDKALVFGCTVDESFICRTDLTIPCPMDSLQYNKYMPFS